MYSPVVPARPVELLLQPVVPLEFCTVRSNPPMNAPQLTPAASSRSPAFCPFIVTTALPEQTSPTGSGSFITVNDPAPPSTTAKVAAAAEMLVAPLVWPETRFNKPGVEGPKPVL